METVNILSYNLCWGCVFKNTKDHTARGIAEKCIKESIGTDNVCLNNMCKIMSETNFDFIATQESPTIDYLKNYRFCKKLLDMGYVHTMMSSRVSLLTFFNKNKFKLVGIMYDNLDSGRPIHTLYLIHKRSKKRLIFVNSHFPHWKKELIVPRLHQYFSNNNCKFYSVDTQQVKYRDKTQRRSVDNCDSYFKNSEPMIIFAGDTNDHYNHKLWKGFTPFVSSNIQEVNKIRIKSDIKPPNTCCKGKKTLRKNIGDDQLYGDYILASKNLKRIRENYIPVFNYNANFYPTSDHLPIASSYSFSTINRSFNYIEEVSNIYEIYDKLVFFKFSEYVVIFRSTTEHRNVSGEIYKKLKIEKFLKENIIPIEKVGLIERPIGKDLIITLDSQNKRLIVKKEIVPNDLLNKKNIEYIVQKTTVILKPEKLQFNSDIEKVSLINNFFKNLGSMNRNGFYLGKINDNLAVDGGTIKVVSLSYSGILYTIPNLKLFFSSFFKLGGILKNTESFFKPDRFKEIMKKYNDDIPKFLTIYKSKTKIKEDPEIRNKIMLYDYFQMLLQNLRDCNLEDDLLQQINIDNGIVKVNGYELVAKFKNTLYKNIKNKRCFKRFILGESNRNMMIILCLLGF